MQKLEELRAVFKFSPRVYGDLYHDLFIGPITWFGVDSLFFSIWIFNDFWLIVPVFIRHGIREARHTAAYITRVFPFLILSYAYRLHLVPFLTLQNQSSDASKSVVSRRIALTDNLPATVFILSKRCQEFGTIWWHEETILIELAGLASCSTPWQDTQCHRLMSSPTLQRIVI